MWFKQAQFVEITTPVLYDAEALEEQLASLAFQPCLSNLPLSCGWAPPIDGEDAPLVHAANGYLLFCLQLEEKILPAAVVRQAVEEKIKKIMATQDRRVSAKEKRNLTEEMTFSLLPKAFTKLSRIYAYIDTNKHRLIIDTVMSAKLERFFEMFKRSLGHINYRMLETKKIAPLLTNWLVHENYPAALSIDKSCVLKDPAQENRVIRCQQQDLSAAPIQALLQDNCQVHQLALQWEERLSFILSEDFSMKSIRYHDEILDLAKDSYSESPEQQFDADFVIMTETLTQLFDKMIDIFAVKAEQKGQEAKETVQVVEMG